MQKRIALTILLAIFFTAAAFAQMGGGKPSPAASASCDLGGAAKPSRPITPARA